MLTHECYTVYRGEYIMKKLSAFLINIYFGFDDYFARLNFKFSKFDSKSIMTLKIINKYLNNTYSKTTFIRGGFYF